MSQSILLIVAKGLLFVVFLAGSIMAMWANWRMTKRRRELGGRYWMINPKRIVASWASVEFPIFIVAVLETAGAVAALKALN